VIRPAAIHISYQKLDGTIIAEDVTGFRARVIMHENDHLNGVLYIDRVSSEQRKGLEPHLRAIKQKYKSPS
jgi:peptide deformylase